MRPEHGCSGNVYGTGLLAMLTVASMRPEHGCSGNGMGPGPGDQGPLRFNEAGARMLRKWRVLPDATAPGPKASMRPEHGCSGNEDNPSAMNSKDKSFNEAGARMLRK